MPLTKRLGPIAAFEQTWPDLADNLACDEALLTQAEESGGPAVVRFWEFDRPAVVLGASCRFRDNVRVEACRKDEVPVARRSSGGGTVMVGPGALNVTLVLSLDAEPVAFRSVDTAQQFILERIAEALRHHGPDVVMLGSGDLTLAGRKFSGSAQRRSRHWLMVHASLLYDFDLELIDRYLAMPPRQPIYRGNRSHADFVTNVPLSRAAIAGAVCRAWDLQSLQGPVNKELKDRIESLSLTKFRDVGWIERL